MTNNNYITAAYWKRATKEPLTVFPFQMLANQTLKDKLNTYIVHSAVVYQKYLTRLREMIIFSPRLENYQFSQPR